ncbi:PLP-dependent aminotransferase family protein [Kibdelosporangium philippinense]|uniref:PLP-dependent aminotransferase family protein n=1 Tax=Kibdelosporangium philippinense TaxID=211113 RepID=A0ABS8Z543_9PSEU|nr:PLP-dependent aminotransferase family protein [Kibdelosporangium philippinense]MCE7003023.1 PLP-dependent aminotransferase family protein [Kibdelosporangium philippinense]
MTGVDLHLDVRGPGVLAGLTDALRDAVRTGRLTPGTRLPSSRNLAVDLGVARNTVVAAYAELIEEGWLTARQGAGTQVADACQPVVEPQPPVSKPAYEDRPLYDLRPGWPDVSSFPRAEWIKATRRAVEQASSVAFSEQALTGRIELRRALSDYLARARGVYSAPERIVISSGASHGLALLAAALRTRRVDTVAVEAYGLPLHRELFARVGLRTPPLPMDQHGARTDRLAGHGAVLLTPAHQFPTGAALDPQRRSTVVDWARSTGGLVIEDDYDGEFRYDRKPVGALQGLDPEHVVYLGTASKAIAPGLRLGWMVVPEGLIGDINRVIGGLSVTGTVEQLAMAELLDSGAYDRHVRVMRARYRQRRDELVTMLASRNESVRLPGIAAGLHALVELPWDTEEATVKSAAARRLAVHGLDEFRHPAVPRDRHALVVGFGTPSPSGWPSALNALRRVLPS